MNKLLLASLLAVIAVSGLTGTNPRLSPAHAQSANPQAPTVITPGGAQDPAQRSYLPQNQQAPGQQPYPAPPPATPGQEPYPAPPPQAGQQGTYSDDEIIATGGRFFGRVTAGLARVVEYTFQNSGRPNGYILGEEAGGAFVAGLRYGEGTLYTKNAGEHKVFWQGPSIGYDFGAEGSKTMILVYNLQRVEDIYETFGGVDGSAYFIGGVGVTFQKHEHVTLAPIRSGVGIRLGANVGYLKYTRKPTWNPF